MKRISSLILVLVLCVSLCACQDVSTYEDHENYEVTEYKSESERAADEVKSEISTYVAQNYDIVGVPQVTTYVKEHGVDEYYFRVYEVTGKVTVRNKYGDTYTATYDATAKIGLSGSFRVTYKVGTLYKD